MATQEQTEIVQVEDLIKKHKKLLDIYLLSHSNGSTNQSVKVRYDRDFEGDMFDGYVAEVYVTGVFTQQIELLNKQGWYCSYILATEKNQIYLQLFHRKAIEADSARDTQ